MYSATVIGRWTATGAQRGLGLRRGAAHRLAESAAARHGRDEPARRLLGLAWGLTIAAPSARALFWADTGKPLVKFMHSLIIVGAAVLGLVLGARKGEWLEPSKFLSLFRDARRRGRYRILDTSVIIDGRIAEVVEVGFLDGTVGRAAVRAAGTAVRRPIPRMR
jgi:uncharacterized protein YacL